MKILSQSKGAEDNISIFTMKKWPYNTGLFKKYMNINVLFKTVLYENKRNTKIYTSGNIYSQKYGHIICLQVLTTTIILFWVPIQPKA
jgi:hypothetical protein